MNEATRKEVTELLTKATHEGLPHAVRVELVSNLFADGHINAIGYAQLLDAINTHNDTGSYEGCVIWCSTEANPIETES